MKFTAYDFSIFGGLEAVVENISPDTVIDEKGNAYYLVRVRTLRPNFDDKLPRAWPPSLCRAGSTALGHWVQAGRRVSNKHKCEKKE